MKYFIAYIKENIRWLAVILCIALTAAATMLLNEIPFFEIAYGMMLCLFLTAVAIVVGYSRHYNSFRQLEQMQKNITVTPVCLLQQASNQDGEISNFTLVPDDMKKPEYMYERQYQNCITILAEENKNIRNEMRNRQQDMAEYYSMWVHQIKTPIAALKLLIDENISAYLELDNIEENDICVTNERQKQNELFRIEQYVDMALQYTRLGAETNDFVIESVLLDEVIKCSIHKYAKQFIHKKLRLTYEPQDIVAVTDKKWLGFVIDQILSNSIKYTKQGGITIKVERIAAALEENADNNASIIIEDTGIGISAEDLPRICEKGYTGYNGHADKYSTGIGLYLCKAILDKLGHRLNITSEIGKGTRVEITYKTVRNKGEM
ncbi:MAG: HAMP domain-containing histidine kinase [Lachnospiraceae bacterium]|nr:HAMP domain-containing histidine kinase [Lachnospiraceae bacterium]